MLFQLTEGTEGAEATQQLAIPAIAYGLLAVVFFAVLLLVTFAFRSVGHRH